MDDETRARIEKEAEDYADSIDRRGCSFWRGLKMGHMSKATAEHSRITELLKEERIKVIDKCLEIIAYERQQYVSGAKLVANILVPIRERIQALKGKQQ